MLLLLVGAVAMVTGRGRPVPAVPRGSRQNSQQFSPVSRRPPLSDGTGGYTACRSPRALSADHYDTIVTDPTTTLRPQSGNCGQDYQDIDELIRSTDQADQPYLTPVEYGFAGAVSGPTCYRGLPYDLIDPDQVDNGHIYVSPGASAAAVTTVKMP